MTVVQRTAERHLEQQAQPLDEILLRVAVIMEGMHQPDGRKPGIEIEPQSIRKPFPGSACISMPPVQPDHGTHRSPLLQTGLQRHSGEPLLPHRQLPAEEVPLLAETD